MSKSFTVTKSQALYNRAQKVISAGVNSGIRRLEKPVPLYFDHGKGSRLWDVDGNESIDYQSGQGALLYGHAPEGLAKAVYEQSLKGTHFAAQCELEIEVAERLVKYVPGAELVRFNNCSTEVVLVAHRLARAYTGRKLILRFEGHYHGWTDEGLVGFGGAPDTWGPEDRPAPRHVSQGVIPEVLEHFLVVQWNDEANLRKTVAQYKDQIAAIVFEPVLCNTSCVPAKEGFYKTIRELCDANGIVMIADETITGFRFGIGGAQAYYGFKPDLTVFGKAVGGGVPFAALCGTAKVMEKITSGEVVHGGTLNASPLVLAASKWALDEVIRLGDSHPANLIKLGNKLMDGLRKLGEKHHIPLRPQGPGLVFHTTILKEGAEEGPIQNFRDYMKRNDAGRFSHLRLMLLEEGVRAIERGLWFLSLAHTEADIDETLVRADRAFARHAKEYKA